MTESYYRCGHCGRRVLDYSLCSYCEDQRESTMTDKQREALQNICDRYHVEFNEDDYKPAFDLPDGYVAGWVGGRYHGLKWHFQRPPERTDKTTIYVGCDPEGRISS